MIKRGMASKHYRDWQAAVLERDNHTCRDCGKVATHAHHIKGWWKSPELRFEVGNGRAMCKPCHEETHGFKFGEKGTLNRVKGVYLCGPIPVDIRTAIENLGRLVRGEPELRFVK